MQTTKEMYQRLRENSKCDRCRSKGTVSCEVKFGPEYVWEWLCKKCFKACSDNGQVREAS